MFNLAEVDLSPQESAAWYDVLGRFRTVSAQFEIAYRDLQTRPIPVDPSLANERAALLQRANTVANTVRQIRGALDDVMAALSGAWDKVTGAWDWISQSVGLNGVGLQGLGLPIIPIAVVATAIGVVTLFLTDYAKYTKRVSMYEQAIAKGASPTEAAAATKQVAEAGGLLSFGGGIPWLMLAIGAGIFLFQRTRRQ